jgi:hypothetical protein
MDIPWGSFTDGFSITLTSAIHERDLPLVKAMPHLTAFSPASSDSTTPAKRSPAAARLHPASTFISSS